MNKPRWITESVLLFVLPVAATTVAFAYEAGYAHYFGIPLDLITLNWTAATLAFLALASVFQLFASSGYVLAQHIARWTPWVTVKTALLLSALIALDGVLLFQYCLHSAPFWIGIALTAGYMLIDVLFRIVASLPGKGLWQRFREGSVQGENADPLSLPFNRFLLVGIWVVISLAIAWSTGYSRARDQRCFLVTRVPQEQVVLRRYGDMFVMAGLDRSKRTVKRNFTFQAATVRVYSVRRRPPSGRPRTLTVRSTWRLPSRRCDANEESIPQLRNWVR